jgi:hypothetical protein
MSDTPTTETPAVPAKPAMETLSEKLAAKADYGLPKEPPAEAPKPKTAEIKADPAALRESAKLRAENLELKAKLEKAAPLEADSAKLAKFTKLRGEGKRLEAYAALVGADVDTTQEMEALLAEHLERPTTDTAAAVDDKADEIIKRIDAEAEARKSLEKRLSDRDAAEQAANVTAFALHTLDATTNEDGSAKFELCAANRNEAAQLAQAHVVTLAKARGIDPEHVSPDAAAALFRDAYADVEAELEAEGKRLEAEAAKYKRKVKQVDAPRTGVANLPQSAPAIPAAAQGTQGSQSRPLAKPAARVVPREPATSLEGVLQKVRERAVY